MIRVTGIGWEPIETMPNNRRDGRHVLLWSTLPWVGCWTTVGNPDGGFWALTKLDDEGTYRRLSPRFWADINPPE